MLPIIQWYSMMGLLERCSWLLESFTPLLPVDYT